MRSLIHKLVYIKYLLNAASGQTLFKHFHRDLIQVLNELLTDTMSGHHSSHSITLKLVHKKYTYLFS
jgi:hypothetical protein